MLLLDLSIHGDSSTVLLGGMEQPQQLVAGGARTHGGHNIRNIPAAQRAAGFLHAAGTGVPLAQVAPVFGAFGMLFGGNGAANLQPFVWRDHAVGAKATHPAGNTPENLFVSAGGPELFRLVTEANLLNAATKLRAALNTMTNAIVFIDTDAELGACTASLIGLAVATDVMLVLSSHWHDYQRLQDDVFNGLFNGLGFLAASNPPFTPKISKVIFNRVQARTNASSPVHNARVLPFTPASGDLKSMEDIVNEIVHDEVIRPYFSDAGAFASNTAFTARYVTGFYAVPQSIMQPTMQKGTPIASMRPADAEVPQDQLTSVVRSLAFLRTQ